MVLCHTLVVFVLPQAEVRPQCGRVVGFGAGKENPHGVKAVTQGQRCAVALWFTLDPAHEEKVQTFSADDHQDNNLT